MTSAAGLTMAQQAQNDYYASTEVLALGYAEAVHEGSQTCSRPARTYGLPYAVANAMPPQLRCRRSL